MIDVKVLNETGRMDLEQRQNAQLLHDPGSSIANELEGAAKRIWTHPNEWEDGVIRPPLLYVGDHLKASGVVQGNIRAGLLVYVAMNSVRLGYPLSLILTTEDPVDATQLLHACKKIAPPHLYREVQGLKAEQLYRDKAFYDSRVIICHDTTEVKKAMPDLLDLLTHGSTTRQTEFKSTLGSGIQSSTAQYPIAFIGIEKPTIKSVISHPSIMRVQVSREICAANQMPLGILGQTQEGADLEIRTIATMFERLKSGRVQIPYLDKIQQSIIGQRPTNLLDKVEIIRKVLSICSIMNNPPPFTSSEAFGKLIGLDMHELSPISNLARPYANLLPDPSRMSGATKVDYYLTTLLLDGIIPIGDRLLTNRQVNVFEAVRFINFSKLSIAAINQNDTIKKLSILPRAPSHWAYMHEIIEIVNRGRKDFVSAPEIEKNLNNLKNLKVLQMKTGDENKGHGYFVLVPDLTSYLTLPRPEQIISLVSEAGSLRVQNPLTGAIDTI